MRLTQWTVPTKSLFREHLSQSWAFIYFRSHICSSMLFANLSHVLRRWYCNKSGKSFPFHIQYSYVCITRTEQYYVVRSFLQSSWYRWHRVFLVLWMANAKFSTPDLKTNSEPDMAAVAAKIFLAILCLEWIQMADAMNFVYDFVND